MKETNISNRVRETNVSNRMFSIFGLVGSDCEMSTLLGILCAPLHYNQEEMQMRGSSMILGFTEV